MTIAVQTTKRIPVSKLKLYGKNPRRGDIAAVTESLRTHGQFRALVVREQTMEVLAGNHTLLGLRELGEPDALCHLIRCTPDQAKRIVLADNRTSDLATYDDQALASLLSSLDGPLDGTGFDDQALADLLASVEPDRAGDDTEPGDVPADPTTQPGDLWLLGNHRLLCGDATNPGDVEQLMDGQTADLLFTSPPYADLRDYSGDVDLSPATLAQFLPTWGEHATLLAVNLGLIQRDHEIVPYWNAYLDAAAQSGLKLLSWSVWNREDATSMAAQRMMFPIWHEWVFVFGARQRQSNRVIPTKNGGKSTTRKQRLADGSFTDPRTYAVADSKRMGSVLTTPTHKGPSAGDFPAAFPVALPTAYISAVTHPTNAIADPFSGSGTTLIACENLHRSCYALEIDPGYCDVIVDRWERHTGQKATRG